MSKNVLIVEDEAIVAMESRLNLISAGYKVVGVVASGSDAIQKFEDEQPDLILMDIKLKGEICGIQAAREIRKVSNVPIVFVTGNSDPATKLRVQDVEHSIILFKPIQSRELFKEINSILQ